MTTDQQLSRIGADVARLVASVEAHEKRDDERHTETKNALAGLSAWRTSLAEEEEQELRNEIAALKLAAEKQGTTRRATLGRIALLVLGSVLSLLAVGLATALGFK